MRLLTAILSDKVVQTNAVGIAGLTLMDIDTIVKIFGGLALFVYTSIKIYKELNGTSKN